MTHALLTPVARAAAAATGGGGSETGAGVASLRWVGVAFLGAAALCFAGFAVLSLAGDDARRASQRLVLGILAAILFLAGVGLGVTGVVAG